MLRGKQAGLKAGRDDMVMGSGPVPNAKFPDTVRFNARSATVIPDKDDVVANPLQMEQMTRNRCFSVAMRIMLDGKTECPSR